MNDRTALLMIRYKSADGTWKRAWPARAANGRLRNGVAIIDGEPTPVDQYQYQVRYYEDRVTKFKPVGTNAAEADNQRATIEKQVSIKAAAPEANMEVVEGPVRRTLKETAADYIAQKEDSHLFEAAGQARLVTREFMDVVRRKYVDEVTTNDILKFHRALRKRGCADRTLSNKHERLKSWLVFGGIDRVVLPPTPTYEQALPTIYDRDQISTMLGEATPEDRILLLLALKLGLREQELMHAEFTDLDVHERIFRVQGKTKWGFKVKDKEQRDVPIPDDVFEELMSWKKAHPEQKLILPGRDGEPEGHLLRRIKQLAKRAKLNCGQCDGCTSKVRECKHFSLHKFRRTYITNLLRNGFDLRTVQHYAGHSDLASTMRYLRPAAGNEVRNKLNAVTW